MQVAQNVLTNIQSAIDKALQFAPVALDKVLELIQMITMFEVTKVRFQAGGLEPEVELEITILNTKTDATKVHKISLSLSNRKLTPLCDR